MSAAGYRLARVQNLLLEVTSEIIRKLKDPRIGFVSITEVEVAPDLRHARIYVSIMGNEEERKGALAALNHASGFVRRELSQSIRLRHIPEVHFRLDSSLEHGAHILDLINKANKTVGGEDAQPPEEAAAPETEVGAEPA